MCVVVALNPEMTLTPSQAETIRRCREGEITVYDTAQELARSGLSIEKSWALATPPIS